MQNDSAEIEEWVGRSQPLTEVSHGVQVRQLAATLNDAQRLAQPKGHAVVGGLA